MEFAAIVALLEQYRYLILFPLACIEGPMLGFITGSLMPLGYFHPVPLFVALVLADVIPDIAYYFLGAWGSNNAFAQRILTKAGLTAERVEYVRTLWHTHTTKAMLFTKFSYGLSAPLLIVAGLVHLPLRRFVAWSVVLAAGQYAVLITLGYFFGSSFSLIENVFARVQILVIAVVVIGVGYYFFTRSMRRMLWKQVDNS